MVFFVICSTISNELSNHSKHNDVQRSWFFSIGVLLNFLFDKMIEMKNEAISLLEIFSLVLTVVLLRKYGELYTGNIQLLFIMFLGPMIIHACCYNSLLVHAFMLKPVTFLGEFLISSMSQMCLRFVILLL